MICAKATVSHNNRFLTSRQHCCPTTRVINISRINNLILISHSFSPSLCFFISLFLSLFPYFSLYLSPTHTHTHVKKRFFISTITNFLSIILYLNLSFPLSRSLLFPFSLFLTIFSFVLFLLSLSLSLSFSHSLFLSLFLS